jgi:antitoxin component YwqK of YwqJK toxin-antitoxin module
MKKIFVPMIVFILMFSGISFAKTVVEKFPNGNRKAVVRYNKKNQLNGPYKYYWLNGQLREQGRYKDGVHVGRIKRYSIDGVELGKPPDDTNN